MLATRSVFYPDTERVMGWDIGGSGFRIVLDASVADVGDLAKMGKDGRITALDMFVVNENQGPLAALDAIETVTGAVPTDKMRRGDFSELLSRGIAIGMTLRR